MTQLLDRISSGYLISLLANLSQVTERQGHIWMFSFLRPQFFIFEFIEDKKNPCFFVHSISLDSFPNQREVALRNCGRY